MKCKIWWSGASVNQNHPEGDTKLKVVLLSPSEVGSPKFPKEKVNNFR